VVTPKLARDLPLGERAYDAIKAMVISNELKPGQALTESGLAETLGISRSPVRGALARLEEEGFLETEPWHGPRVAPLTAKYVKDLYQVRAALETLCARESAHRIPGEEIEAFYRLVASLAAPAAAGDLSGLLAADDRFHTMLVEHCENELLQIIVRRLRDHVTRVTNAIAGDIDLWLESEYEEMTRIVAALKSRDADRLAAIVEAHMAGFATRMTESFERSQSAVQA
jgi:DNA-binding GntR family transcriptional regulator